jgi:hypothetical protein
MRNTDSDPHLPERIGFLRRGGLVPTDPIERARVLEKRVIALQEFGLRLRAAAERVAESARQRGDGYVASAWDLPTLEEDSR